jgi:hypothetical protein
MSDEIILQVIWPTGRQSPIAWQAEVRKYVITRGGCGYSIIRRVDPWNQTGGSIKPAAAV